MILFDLLMGLVEGLGDACGNLFTTGSADGLTPKQPLGIVLIKILAIFLLVCASFYFGFFF